MGAWRGIQFLSLAAAMGCFALPHAAVSDHGPVIVVPGRAGVPVMMHGRDISGAVVEGDWGLYRAGNVAPTVIMPFRHRFGWGPGGAHYFPATGQRPRYGRFEIETPESRIQQEAEPYSRSWEVQSRPLPATIPTPYEMPPVILDERFRDPGPRPFRPRR